IIALPLSGVNPVGPPAPGCGRLAVCFLPRRWYTGGERYDKGAFAMFLEGLDALDQRIVQLLIENARMSYSDIGQAVCISRVAVKARIQALEQRGVIEEYTTIINPQKISGAVSCYFEIETRPDTLAEVTDRLAANETVTQIY